MAEYMDAVFEEKGINPPPEHRELIEARWVGLKQLEGDVAALELDSAEISLRHVAGGDHLA